MNKPTKDQDLLLALIDGVSNLERRLDRPLAGIRGISYAEFRILRAIGAARDSRISRVDLANRVGLSPSGVTRALRPLEKLGFISTEKSERDARLAMATLTAQGEDLLSDSIGVVNDAAKPMLDRSPAIREHAEVIWQILFELGG